MEVLPLLHPRTGAHTWPVIVSLSLLKSAPKVTLALNPKPLPWRVKLSFAVSSTPLPIVTVPRGVTNLTETFRLFPEKFQSMTSEIFQFQSCPLFPLSWWVISVVPHAFYIIYGFIVFIIMVNDFRIDAEGVPQSVTNVHVCELGSYSQNQREPPRC